ncbi:hypothetical protein GCM10009661_60870 [Catellatospora chokoriensis]|uniref:NIPSNAP domain-containing protein n=1 Tax=Catellatospora chokoriensis TaxID=310353 RepID=A0A8J3JXR9_9ACTN|nr:hypothetical protein Cch02nite_64650 [Catellatospora chokoriensis]
MWFVDGDRDVGSAAGGSGAPLSVAGAMMPGVIVEIRTYQIKPGERDEFVRVMRTQSVPLLQKFGIAVLDCGPSLVDEDGAETAYLIRAFPAREIRDEQETTFYASPQWRRGPREAIVSRIESSHTVVLEMPAAAVEALRR